MPDRRELTEQVLARVLDLAVRAEDLEAIVIKLVAQADFRREPIDDALQICRALGRGAGIDRTMVRAAGLLDLALRVGHFSHPSPETLLRSALREAQEYGDGFGGLGQAKNVHPSGRHR